MPYRTRKLQNDMPKALMSQRIGFFVGAAYGIFNVDVQRLRLSPSSAFWRWSWATRSAASRKRCGRFCMPRSSSIGRRLPLIVYDLRSMPSGVTGSPIPGRPSGLQSKGLLLSELAPVVYGEFGSRADGPIAYSDARKLAIHEGPDLALVSFSHR